MLVADFHYELPQHLIAQYPTPRRTDSRLLSLDGNTGALCDLVFSALPEALLPGDLLVFNDTRVVRARLYGVKTTGGKVEILVERVLDDRRALAHVRANRALKPGARIRLAGDAGAVVLQRRGDFFELEFNGPRTLAALLAEAGKVPLPPYIRRPAEAIDEERYQTVYARRNGAVAAPTAGLHFDRALMARLADDRIEQAFVTLHVGGGTFQPVREERVEDHHMHAEDVEVSAETCAKVNEARRRGTRVVAVGTTSVRALEASAALNPGENGLRPFHGDTSLFIYPGYRFRCVDAMISNFHLPGSTLLMLVCAFAGRENVLRAYRHAVREGYRFYSYGDAMFLTRRTT